jgi:hypothetical protein
MQNTTNNKTKNIPDARWFDKKLSAEEFKLFVDDALNGPENTQTKQVYIGDICPEASKRIEAVCGETMTRISIDNGQIRHAYFKKAHNLDNDDIFHFCEIINSTTNISPSDREFLHNKSLIFK